jgi:hypothetical protein
MANKKSKTIKDAYKDYDKKNKTDKDFKLDYKTYRKICTEFNSKVSDKILKEAFEFKLFGGIGTIRVRKLKLSNTQRRVDWNTTKKHNVKVYHLNFHTDENYYKWFWHKKRAIFANKTAYSFVPIRKNKRTLAQLLKENKVEFFN